MRRTLTLVCPHCDTGKPFKFGMASDQVDTAGLEVQCPAGHRFRLVERPNQSQMVGGGENPHADSGASEIGQHFVEQEWFHGPCPADAWEREAAGRALDELFLNARAFRSTAAYLDLIRFVARFRFYAPFNAMLVHTQMPGARYVAPATRWRKKWKRRVKPGSRPLVILQPGGPVMFVFDVSDTEPEPGAPPLPASVDHPFEVRSGKIGCELEQVVANARRDGVACFCAEHGSQQAGAIRSADRQGVIELGSKRKPPIDIPLRFELLINRKLSKEARFATVVHELGHLYCGHLGSPDENWWPDRRGLRQDVRELEAESVCFLVCGRLGIDNPSVEYMSSYVENQPETPPISLDSVMGAATLIEKMTRERLPPRKEKARAPR